jgi:transposase
VYVDGNGIPLGVILSEANAHDSTRIRDTLESGIVPRPSPKKMEQHICLDKGYDGESIRRSMRRRGYIAHIPHRGMKVPVDGHARKGRARRWVVERTNRWHNLFRRLKIRYEVHAENYLGFVQFACAIICYRRARAA